MYNRMLKSAWCLHPFMQNGTVSARTCSVAVSRHRPFIHGLRSLRRSVILNRNGNRWKIQIWPTSNPCCRAAQSKRSCCGVSDPRWRTFVQAGGRAYIALCDAPDISCGRKQRQSGGGPGDCYGDGGSHEFARTFCANSSADQYSERHSADSSTHKSERGCHRISGASLWLETVRWSRPQ